MVDLGNSEWFGGGTPLPVQKVAAEIKKWIMDKEDG